MSISRITQTIAIANDSSLRRQKATTVLFVRNTCPVPVPCGKTFSCPHDADAITFLPAECHYNKRNTMLRKYLCILPHSRNS